MDEMTSPEFNFNRTPSNNPDDMEMDNDNSIMSTSPIEESSTSQNIQVSNENQNVQVTSPTIQTNERIRLRKEKTNNVSNRPFTTKRIKFNEDNTLPFESIDEDKELLLSPRKVAQRNQILRNNQSNQFPYPYQNVSKGNNSKSMAGTSGIGKSIRSIDTDEESL